MRVLFCCQFYAPSVGGVQEVVRQLAERLVTRGHQVTVATTKLPNRDFETLNGVSIKEFAVTGNLAGGMSGEIDSYQKFVRGGDFDVMLVYAAQQWTFDALWPILDAIPCAKVLVPCGFSGLYEPGYASYFQALPDILRKFEHLVFHASRYRDIDFARAHGIGSYSVIPNGASEEVFNVPADPSFRSRHDIPEHSFLFLTVGSFTGLKGHLEVTRAFAQMKLPPGRHATLMLNGNKVQVLDSSVRGLLAKFRALIRTHGLSHAVRRLWKRQFGASDSPVKVAKEINKSQLNKQVVVTDLERAELTQAFMATDLFVFASNIEYSPLVLFECAAAGTPFVAADVGNAEEIARWTGAGLSCPSHVDSKGYTRVDEAALARLMGDLMEQGATLTALGEAGRRNWLGRFTWGKIAIQYEQLFEGLCKLHAAPSERMSVERI